MHRAAALIAVLLALAAWPQTTPAASRCPPAGAKVDLRKDRVVVYHTRAGNYACSLVTGRRTWLGDGDVVQIYEPPVIAVRGALLAYVSVEYGNEAEASVLVIDTARARNDDAPVVGGADIGDQKVGGVALAPGGSVAWVTCAAGSGPFPDPAPECVRPRSRNEVWARRQGAREPRLLDRKGRIDPRSLRIQGTRVSWVRDGRRRSTTLR